MGGRREKSVSVETAVVGGSGTMIKLGPLQGLYASNNTKIQIQFLIIITPTSMVQE